MGHVPLPPPITEAEQAEGLRQGRDLYREDLERMARQAARDLLLVLVPILLGIIAIGSIVLLLSR